MNELAQTNQLHKHPVMQRLFSLGLGTHWCGCFKGYITIEGNENKYEVMWTSGKNTHDPIMSGSSISVEFTENGAGLVFKSAITMHPVTNENEKEQCIKFIEKKITSAYHITPLKKKEEFIGNINRKKKSIQKKKKNSNCYDRKNS